MPNMNTHWLQFNPPPPDPNPSSNPTPGSNIPPESLIPLELMGQFGMILDLNIVRKSWGDGWKTMT